MLAFARTSAEHRVLVILNLSNEPRQAIVEGELVAGTYEDALTGETILLPDWVRLDLRPWDFRVYAR